MYRSTTVLAAVALCAPLVLVSCDGDDDGNGDGGEQIVVTAPVAGSKFVGGLDTITVSYTPAMSSVTVEFNYNDVVGSDAQYATIASATMVGQNGVKFVPPGRNMSDSATIRISDASGANTAGMSSRITVKHIVLTAPAASSTQTAGQPFNVQWRSNIQVTGVNVKTSDDGGENWTQHNIGRQVDPADATWADFPVTLTAAAPAVLVKVESYIDPAVKDQHAIVVQ